MHKKKETYKRRIQQARTQQKERRKKRGTDRESNIKQRRNTYHRFVYEISLVDFVRLCGV